jgi:hypothetical protein
MKSNPSEHILYGSCNEWVQHIKFPYMSNKNIKMDRLVTNKSLVYHVDVDNWFKANYNTSRDLEQEFKYACKIYNIKVNENE